MFAAVSAGGGAIGLLAGGMLTEWLDWRWVFFVNVPIGVLIAVLAPPMYINESDRHSGRFDISGALTSTLGMASLVYGFIRASEEGWRDSLTLASFGAAVVLLAAFVLVEMKAKEPITPPADVRRPQPFGHVRDHAQPGRRHVRHVLLHRAVRAERPGLQPPSNPDSRSCR